MAWTNPRTWVANELVTAAQMNTHVRDNLNANNSQPSVRIFGGAAQSPFSATWTRINMITSTGAGWDTDTMETGTSVVTIKTAGKYALKGGFAWAANTTGSFRMGRFYVNSTTIIDQVTGDSFGGTSNPVFIKLACEYAFAVNDTIEMQGYQDSGGVLAVDMGTIAPWMSVHRLSD